MHPQSIVHSMVELTDGATIAQLSMPDMRLPIGYALAYPDRLGTAVRAPSTGPTLGRLDFEAPDLEAFPCLGLAYEAGRAGGTAPAWLNAANEVAVAAFLDGRHRAGSTSPTSSKRSWTGMMGRWPAPSSDVVEADRGPERWPRAVIARESAPSDRHPP